MWIYAYKSEIIGRDNCHYWFLDDEIPRHKSEEGYVKGQVESIRWEESRTEKQ